MPGQRRGTAIAMTAPERDAFLLAQPVCRVGTVDSGGVDELRAPEQLFADKYTGGEFRYDGRHGWLRVVPEKVVSWDFAKLRPRR